MIQIALALGPPSACEIVNSARSLTSVCLVSTPRSKPRFVDYLFISFYDDDRFSPTEAMLLTTRAKPLIMLQSIDLPRPQYHILSLTLVELRRPPNEFH